MAKNNEDGAETSQNLHGTSTRSSSPNTRLRHTPDPFLVVCSCFSVITALAAILCICVNVLSAIRSFKNGSCNLFANVSSPRAMREVWPYSLERVNLIEPSQSMQRAGQGLLRDVKNLPLIHNYSTIQSLSQGVNKSDRPHDLVIVV